MSGLTGKDACGTEKRKWRGDTEKGKEGSVTRRADGRVTASRRPHDIMAAPVPDALVSPGRVGATLEVKLQQERPSRHFGRQQRAQASGASALQARGVVSCATNQLHDRDDDTAL